MSDSTVRSSKQDFRQHLVLRKTAQWREDLMASAPIDQLLHPTQRCLVDTTGMAAHTLSQLVAGEPVDVKHLVAESSQAARRWQNLTDEITFQYQQLGIQTGYLAIGFAQWRDADATTSTPVLLYPIEIEQQRDTATMTLDNDPVVNPILIEHLATVHRVDVSEHHFPIPDNTNPMAVLDRVTSQITRAAAGVSGFCIETSSALCVLDLSRFHLAKDLEAAETLLPDNTILAALSGDELARRAVSADSAAPSSPTDTRPVATEFHVLDADADQSRVVDSAVNGESLVVDAPPGTGKSQTIVNLIAALAARNQRVLFVSQKRNAIDTVTRRLHEVGLGEILLDINDGAHARARAFDHIRRRVEQANDVAAADTAPTQEQLTYSRAALLGFYEAIHGKRTPWNLSVFDLRCLRSHLVNQVTVHSRLDAQCLSHLEPAIRQCIARDLRSYTELGGFSLDSSVTAWSGAQLDSAKTCDRAIALASETAHAWTSLMAALDALTAVIGPMPAASLPQWRDILGFLHGIGETFEVFTGDVWNAPLGDWIAATATAKWRKENGIKLSWRRRKRLLRNVRRCWAQRGFDPALAHKALVNAQQQRKRWHHMDLASYVPLPDIPVASASRALAKVEETMAPLAQLFPTLEPQQWPTTVVGAWLERLDVDRRYPPIIRQIRTLRAELDAAGLAKLMAEMDSQRPTAAQAQDIFTFCFAQSLLDYLAYNDSRSSEYHRLPLDQTVRDFVAHDRDHQKLNAARVWHRNVSHLERVQSAETDACRLVAKQLSAKPNRSAIRRIFAEGEPVITAAFPCVALSSRNVAGWLPSESTFDVVIFDDAGRVAVHDAISAIARSRRTVVFGDSQQLRPARYQDRHGQDNESSESLLDALAHVLPVHRLRNHYRSNDHGLVGFAQQRAYKSLLAPFPGRGADACVSHVIAGPGVTDVVTRTADLVIDHVQNHSDLSLGVIADTESLAANVRQRLAEEARHRRELEDLFNPTGPEPFVVKTAGAWQGDEREVVIVAHVATGSAWDTETDEAERLVTVASTRGRSRVITVGPSLSGQVGGQSPIQAFVDYVCADGSQDVSVREDDGLNPFETEIADRLRRHQITVTALRDSAGQRIGLAAMHPRRRHEAVLAIESDGADVVGAASVRDRHRLRIARLQKIGWPVHWVWSVNWWNDPDAEVDKIVDAYTAARDRLMSTPKPVRQPMRPVCETPPEKPAESSPEAPVTATCASVPPITVTGGPITSYRHEDLVTLVAWLCEEHGTTARAVVHSHARDVLGFKRRGRRIDAALDKAYGAAVKSRKGSTRKSTG